MLVTITSINTEGSIIDERLGERRRFYFFKVDGPDSQDTISYTLNHIKGTDTFSINLLEMTSVL